MADILIGNVRGPQGETGPSNKLLATVYSFCESDSPNEIPAGPWLDNLEDVEKGKWYWCKNTMTWEDGPESYLYSVGYVGFDGDFTGVELVQALENRVKTLEDRTLPISKGGTESTTLEGAQAKLGITALQTKLTQAIEDHKKVATETENGLMSAADKKHLDGINDYTTGINLLRGTRDFSTGTIQTYSKNYFRDGFTKNTTQYCSYYTDDFGFTVVKFARNDAANVSDLFVNSSTITDYKVGDKYTISFDVMVDDVSSWDGGRISRAFVIDGSTGNALQTVVLEKPKTDFKSGEWQRISYVFEPTISNGNSFIVIRLDLAKNGSINFKKLAANKGEIDNQIWAPAPADLAVEPINDITTGINLIRSSRDMLVGTKSSGNLSNAFTDDGLSNNTNIVRTVDKDGFTYITIPYGKASVSYVTSNKVYGIEKGKTYTVSFDYRMDKYPTSNSFFGFISVYNANSTSVTNGRVISKDILPSELGDELGIWKQYVYHVTIPDTATIDDESFLAVVFYLNSGSNTGQLSTKKPCVYDGYIENPEWTASPFDVAQQSQMNAIESAGLMASLIPQNQDLNELTYPCNYFCNDPALKSTLRNTPESSGTWALFHARPFFAQYGSKTNTAYRATVQFWTDISNFGMYMRKCENNGTFGEWKKMF